MTPPHYFDKIRERAAGCWDQLEKNPELAGPWHQLFMQVQSPRHILSELLQNADDACATEASVRIEDGFFVFEHNGEDFTEEHFESICRFGYSNKRALHTIGFRGIGFKSTFSLDDQVELYTPTLSVSFNRRRFTEPSWLGQDIRLDGKTCIRVAISDQHRLLEVEKNLEEWLESPFSLLFFKHIRRMTIREQEVHWCSLDSGPVPDSEWMALQENIDESYLLVRSASEPFPDEALNEIRQERMLGNDEVTDFPPCKIEIVMGVKGRLFVVLPTGVETTLPFACNAPFIQDPARIKIKDPETSPTNRWLLRRAGKLAASTMLSWLQQTDMAEVERARAYGFSPDVNREDNSLEGVCGTIVKETFEEEISGKPFLLSHDGALTLKKRCVILPEPIYDVWPPEQAAALLDGQGRPPLSRYIVAADRQKLLNWGVVEKISKETLLRILQVKNLPQPHSWLQLLNLWAYIAPEITGYRPLVEPNGLRIIPVQGKEVLYSAAEVVRLGENRMLNSEADWQFLSEFLIVLNQKWPRFLAEKRRAAEENEVKEVQQAVNAAHAVLRKIGLDDTSDVSRVIDRMALKFFARQSVTVAECVQLAQISAKLGATISDRFKYVTQDCNRRSKDCIILFDADGTLEDLVPENDRASQLLNPDYTRAFTSCTAEEWNNWVRSGRSGLFLFVPFIEKKHPIYGRDKVDQELRRRGLTGIINFQYVTNHFEINDWDFVDSYWHHWHAMSVDDDRVWGRITERIFLQTESFWSGPSNVRALHIATNRSKSAITREPLLPSWALKLRDLSCLQNTRGFYHKPGDLLRRTPETEALIDVEPFVHYKLDREATRPLLGLLGVRSSPTGPDRLLDRLRALSNAENPPAHDVEKWYRRLDQLADACSTIDFENIRQAFRSEKLILTAGGGWATSASVFIAANDEDVPGADVIRSSIGYLTLWRKINVADRPTADLAIQWLHELPSRNLLSQDDARRVRALLVRHPVRIWNESGHWLNLVGEWVPVGDLSYAVTMQSLVAWGHLYEWVKQKTANLRSLNSETAMSPPFSALIPLASVIEDRLHRDPSMSGSRELKPWLVTLGEELSRIELDDEAEKNRIRELANNLSNTDWQNTSGLEITPYIDGTPAGTPRRADVVWLGRVLYVGRLSKAKLAKLVPEEIGKQFNQSGIKDAIIYSFDRSPEDIMAYMEENFKLAPQQEAITSEIEPVIVTTTRSDGINEPPASELPQPEETHEATDLVPTAEEIITGETEETKPGVDEVLARPPRSDNTHRPGPSLIDRFASAQGFRKRKENDDQFFRPDGSRLAKTSNGDRFPWELRSATGIFIRYFLPKDHCLQQHPLQLDADVWGLIDSSPDTYSLVLADAEGKAIEMTGIRLRHLKDEGKLKIYPATYRFVMESD